MLSRLSAVSPSGKAMETNHYCPRTRDFLSRLMALSNSMRLSLKSSTGVADPRDMKRGISCPRQKCNKSPGAPSPRISCEAWWGQRPSCGFPHRKPHTRPWLGSRSRKSGVLRAFCEGWDTTNLDTDRRISHPLPRAQRMGHPPFRGASCRVKHQPRLNRELVSSQSSTGVADPRRPETGFVSFQKAPTRGPF